MIPPQKKTERERFSQKKVVVCIKYLVEFFRKSLSISAPLKNTDTTFKVFREVILQPHCRPQIIRQLPSQRHGSASRGRY